MRTFFAVGLTLLLAGQASAASGKKGPKLPRVMQLDIPGDKSFEPNTIKVINQFVAGALRDQGFQVITAADIAGALGVERQKQLMGCSDSSCLAEIGGALGADYIVHGTLAVLEKNTAITLTLTDSKGLALQQVRTLVPGHAASDLLPAIEGMVPKLAAPVKASAALTAEARPAGEVAGTRTSSGEPSHTLSYAVLGVAGALLVGAAISTGVTYNAFNNLKSNYTESGASSLRNLDHLSDGLWAGALVAGGAGAVLYLTASPAGGAPGAGGELGLHGTF